jgi:hypothetical protein
MNSRPVSVMSVPLKWHTQALGPLQKSRVTHDLDNQEMRDNCRPPLFAVIEQLFRLRKLKLRCSDFLSRRNWLSPETWVPLSSDQDHTSTEHAHPRSPNPPLNVVILSHCTDLIHFCTHYTHHPFSVLQVPSASSQLHNPKITQFSLFHLLNSSTHTSISKLRIQTSSCLFRIVCRGT